MLGDVDHVPVGGQKHRGPGMGRVRAGRCRECFSGLLSGGTGGRPAFRILGHRSFFRAALYITFFIRIIRAPLPRKENTTRIRDALKHFQMI